MAFRRRRRKSRFRSRRRSSFKRRGSSAKRLRIGFRM